IYLTQTRVDGRVAIRFQAGQFEATADDVDMAFDVVTGIARQSAIGISRLRIGLPLQSDGFR
ncbi:MAG: hypothetical protein E5V85_22740, partial [Mesorhizobium sp.]